MNAHVQSYTSYFSPYSRSADHDIGTLSAAAADQASGPHKCHQRTVQGVKGRRPADPTCDSKYCQTAGVHNAVLTQESVHVRKNQVQNQKISVQDVRDAMQEIVRKLAQPVGPGESIKAQQNKVAQTTGLSWVRVKKYWYGLINDPPAVDFMRIQAAYARWLSDREAQLDAELKDLREELDARG